MGRPPSSREHSFSKFEIAQMSARVVPDATIATITFGELYASAPGTTSR
ncbi:hypothetical protein [Sinorhizobium meliloti]